jgi:hypothetical protein
MCPAALLSAFACFLTVPLLSHSLHGTCNPVPPSVFLLQCRMAALVFNSSFGLLRLARRVGKIRIGPHDQDVENVFDPARRSRHLHSVSAMGPRRIRTGCHSCTITVGHVIGFGRGGACALSMCPSLFAHTAPQPEYLGSTQTVHLHLAKDMEC